MTARLPINLMLVEDERIVAFDLKRQLTGFGYNVASVVASGEQAIKSCSDVNPDLVLMDIHLDGQMDGIEAASVIRSRHRLPVVFLTAYAEDETLKRALGSRPFGYLVKPCEGRELHATIQMALARHDDEVTIQQARSGCNWRSMRARWRFSNGTPSSADFKATRILAGCLSTSQCRSTRRWMRLSHA